MQLLNLALLFSGAETIESWLLAKQPLLLTHRHALMLGHPLGQMPGSLGIGPHRIRSAAIRRTSGGIALCRSGNITTRPLAIIGLLAIGLLTAWRIVAGPTLRSATGTPLLWTRLGLGVRRRRGVRCAATVLACKGQRRQRQKNSEAGSLRCLSSNSRSGLNVLHRRVFLAFAPSCA